MCLHYQTEPLHTEACTPYKRAVLRLTHSYIIAEYVALATARRFPRSPVLAFVVDLLDNLMRQRGILEALSSDRHFEQEGFIRLLRPAA